MCLCVQAVGVTRGGRDARTATGLEPWRRSLLRGARGAMLPLRTRACRPHCTHPGPPGTVPAQPPTAHARPMHGPRNTLAGGDSVAAVTAAGLDGAITHISTGGGASLELIEGERGCVLVLLLMCIVCFVCVRTENS